MSFIARSGRSIGFIRLQEGKIKEAEKWLIPGARTHASWGLTGLAQYKEIIGDFDAAEKLMQTEMQSYSESGPFFWWACCYRTNHANLQKSMEAILERYARYKGTDPLVLGTLPALASFHGDRMALVVSLKPAEEPTTMFPKPDSNCVRIEVKKVANLPVREPMITIETPATKSGMAAMPGNDSENGKWMGQARLIVLGVAALAIVSTVLLSFFGKKKASKTKDSLPD